jgi:hypothetical protein
MLISSRQARHARIVPAEPSRAFARYSQQCEDGAADFGRKLWPPAYVRRDQHCGEAKRRDDLRKLGIELFRIL